MHNMHRYRDIYRSDVTMLRINGVALLRYYALIQVTSYAATQPLVEDKLWATEWATGIDEIWQKIVFWRTVYK